jgi:integrase
LKPVGEKIGLKLSGYHTFRRGLATGMHQDGSADKNIQEQLRHSDPATTRNVYMRGVPEQQKKAVESLWKKSKAS